MEDKPFMLRNGLSLEKDIRCLLRLNVNFFMEDKPFVLRIGLSLEKDIGCVLR